tara:strand:- start:13 stop:1161 length:1149 start_codon:yes stop_codon:yes gene_type:complete
MNLLDKQRRKWEELDTFFKTNSKHYKKLDNKDYTFTVWKGGAGGDFVVSLFLNNLLLDFSSQNHDIPSNLFYENRYPQLVPMIENRLENIIYIKNQTIADLSHTNKKYYNKLLNAYTIWKKLEIPEDLTDFDFDYIFSTAFISELSYTNLNPITAHHLPVIPYFYYKNYNKVKVIVIKVINESVQQYVSTLSVMKRGDNCLRDLLAFDYSEFERFSEDEKKDISKEIWQLFNKIKQVSTSNAVHGAIAELLLQCIGNDEFKTVGLLCALDKKMHEYIVELDKINLNKTETIVPPTKWLTTARPESGMLNFLPSEQLYEITYEDLIINQDTAVIKQLMQLYNSNQDVLYYKTQIQLYHERNIKLFNQLKEDLHQWLCLHSHCA